MRPGRERLCPRDIKACQRHAHCDSCYLEHGNVRRVFPFPLAERRQKEYVPVVVLSRA